MRREALLAAALFALLACAFLGQAVATDRVLSSADYLRSAAPWGASRPAAVPPLGTNPELVDAVTQFEPFLQWTRAHLPDVPLWNPHIMGGRPYVGNAQSAIFSPYSVPSYVLPFWQSLEWNAVLKLWVAAMGAFLLARVALGIGFAGALLTGTAFAFGLFYVSWLQWPLASVWSWLPWMLLLADRAARRPGPAAAAGLAVVVALQFFGGHPESSFHVVAAATAFFGLRAAQRWRADGRRALMAPALTFSGGGLLGGALAAVALVPLVELMLRSSDLVERGDDPPAVTEPKYLLGLLLADYWGRPTSLGIESLQQVRAMYAGALPLLLAGAALLVRPTATRAFFAALAAVSLAVVVGLQPVTALVRLVPGFDAAHNTRLTIVALLGIAVLAGFGLDELAAGVRRRSRAVLGLAAALLLAPVALVVVRGEVAPLGAALDVAWGFEDVRGEPTDARVALLRTANVLVWVTVAGAALALVLARLRGRLAATPFAVLAVALVVADLFRAGVGQNPAIPAATARQPDTPALAYLRSRAPARFVGLPAPAGPPALIPNVAMTQGLYDARGYDFPVELRYSRLWERFVWRDVALIPELLATADAVSLPALGLLAVGDVVQDPASPPLRLPGLRLAYDGPDARIYANDRALPRARVVDSVQVVEDGEAALAAVVAPLHDRSRTAVAERPIAGLPARPGPGTSGGARITALEPERVVVRARSEGPGLLVLADAHAPGWKAWVDGRPAPVHRVDYLLRGVPLPGGEQHVVELRYEPASWRIGRLASLAALLVVLGLLAYARAVPTRTAGARKSSRSYGRSQTSAGARSRQRIPGPW